MEEVEPILKTDKDPNQGKPLPDNILDGNCPICKERIKVGEVIFSIDTGKFLTKDDGMFVGIRFIQSACTNIGYVHMSCLYDRIKNDSKTI